MTDPHQNVDATSAYRFGPTGRSTLLLITLVERWQSAYRRAVDD